MLRHPGVMTGMCLTRKGIKPGLPRRRHISSVAPEMLKI
jgi:hypothetical protein